MNFHLITWHSLTSILEVKECHTMKRRLPTLTPWKKSPTNMVIVWNWKFQWEMSMSKHSVIDLQIWKLDAQMWSGGPNLTLPLAWLHLGTKQPGTCNWMVHLRWPVWCSLIPGLSPPPPRFWGESLGTRLSMVPSISWTGLNYCSYCWLVVEATAWSMNLAHCCH